MTEVKPNCPYCKMDDLPSKGPRCSFCGMKVGVDFLMLIDGEGTIVNLCSPSCLDLFLKSNGINEEMEPCEQNAGVLRLDLCPICGKETSTVPYEAVSMCMTCGMLIDFKSVRFILRGRSTDRHFCCSKCLNMSIVAHASGIL
jgi:hypothetical protein